MPLPYIGRSYLSNSVHSNLSVAKLAGENTVAAIGQIDAHGHRVGIPLNGKELDACLGYRLSFGYGIQQTIDSYKCSFASSGRVRSKITQ